MLYDAAEDPGSLSAEELRTAYVRELADAVTATGLEETAERSGVDRDRLAALTDGGDPEFTLSEAAAVLGAREGTPDATAVEQEVRDHLLMGMTTAVLDVDTLAAGTDLDLSGQEVQQAIEGRIPMTLSELAGIQVVIEERKSR